MEQHEMDSIKLYRGISITLLAIVGFMTSATVVMVYQNNNTVTELKTISTSMQSDIDELKKGYVEVKQAQSYERGRADERNKVLRKETSELLDSYLIMDEAEVNMALACIQMDIVDQLTAN